MENFFVRFSEKRNFNTEHIVYDDGVYVDNSSKSKITSDGRVLLFSNSKLKLEFDPIFIKNFAHDILLLSSDQHLYRINKYKKDIEEIGIIQDKILVISATISKFLIITDKEILFFNDYFELEKSIEFDGALEPVSASFGDDIFAVVCRDSFIIYSFSLDVLGSYTNSVKSTVYISKYNVFACAVEKEIKFIEPNGLEHGEPIPFESKNLSILKIAECDLLVSSMDNKITLFYCKNFYWYKKLEFSGKFYKTENNCVIASETNKESKQLIFYYLYREMNDTFVIDGSDLLYTNFSRAIIPPPLYYKKMSHERPISSFVYKEGKLFVLCQNILYKYVIDSDDNITLKGKVELSNFDKPVNDFLIIKNELLLRVDNQIYKINCPEAIGHDNEANQKTEAVLLNSIEGNVVKIYEINNQMAVLFADGLLKYNGCFKFDLNLSLNFDLQISFIKNRLYFLGNKNLLTFSLDEKISEKLKNLKVEENSISDSFEQNVSPLSRIENVSSFLVHNEYLIYISNGKMVIENEQSQSTSYAEDGLTLLAVKDNRIICQTRFGTLETVTNRLFSKSLIKDVLSKGKIKLAADLCDRNHVDYEIFFNSTSDLIENGEFKGKCPLEYIDHLEDNQLFALLNNLQIKNTVYLETDALERISNQFNTKMVYEDYLIDGENAIEKLITLEKGNEDNCIDDLFIRNSSIDHLFSFKYNGTKELFDLKINSADDINYSCCTLNDNAKVDMRYIDLNFPVKSLNAVFSRLDSKKHLNTIVNLFIKINRIDLCFYIENLQKIVKILLTKFSPESIAKYSIKTMDIERIMEVYKLVQVDYAAFYNFFISRDILEFSIYDYLEEKKKALYYLLKHEINCNNCTDGLENNLSQSYSNILSSKVADYVVKNRLFDQLLMFQKFKIFPQDFYTFVAEHETPEKSFKLLLLAKNNAQALKVGMDKLFWRECLELFYSEELAQTFIVSLSNNGRYRDCGEIYEKYLINYDLAVENYVKAKAIRSALNIYKLKEHKKEFIPVIKTGSIELLKNCITEFNEIYKSYEKYKNRISDVRDKLDENMSLSQTSFSYTSQRSLKKALTKDRPGGIYEHEYVLNKIREFVIQFCEWREFTEELLEVFAEFDLNECTAAHNELFSKIKGSLRSEVEQIWLYERPDYDPSRPVIEKPAVTAFFD